MKLTHGFEGGRKPGAAPCDRIVPAATQQDDVGFVQCGLRRHAAQEVEDTNPIPIAAKGAGERPDFVLPHGVVVVTDLEE